MSIKDRLAKKTQDLLPPSKAEAGTAPATSLRTGPGQMLMVNSLMRESNERVAVLEERLKQFEGGLPVRFLDPQQIEFSKWANRIPQSFDGVAFRELKAEIAEAGGNVQPIKVRSKAGEAERFEIIFGHRRYRACLELGLPVLAMIEELSDAELFKQMDRENRSRADLSPWEQGVMYKQALRDKLFSSREHLARELAIDPGNLSKALRLADLDDRIVAAFPSPLDLQYRWAKPLADAVAHDRARVDTVLLELGPGAISGKSGKYVFDRLVGAVIPEGRLEQVRVGKKIVAEIQVTGDRVSVRFGSGVLDDGGIERLRAYIQGDLR